MKVEVGIKREQGKFSSIYSKIVRVMDQFTLKLPSMKKEKVILTDLSRYVKRGFTITLSTVLCGSNTLGYTKNAELKGQLPLKTWIILLG